MAMQTWLALLLCLFCLCVSVYSLVSYIRDRRKQKIPFAAKKSVRKKIIKDSPIIKKYTQ